MLEKLTGNVNAQKFRVILLLEVDFNTMYKIIFSNWLIPNLKLTDAIPAELIGGRRSQIDAHLVLDKKLISSISSA